MDIFQTMQQVGSSNVQLIRQLYRMFDYLVENKWFVEKYTMYAKVIERKILNHLHFHDLLENSLKYLKLLFDIEQQFEVDDTGHVIRYIISTTSGKKVYC